MIPSPEPQPEFDGQCAFALSTGKKGVAGTPTLSALQGGKKYLFSNPVAKVLWHVLPGRKQKAETTWSRP
jgi:hypothetical protein